VFGFRNNRQTTLPFPGASYRFSSYLQIRKRVRSAPIRFAHYGSLENATSFELARAVSFPNSRISQDSGSLFGAKRSQTE
jgi:hypothetical protein